MSTYKMLYLAILVVFESKLTMAVTQPRSDCQTTCGNLTIPFPFGMSSECYLNERFLIKCDTTTNTTSFQGQGPNIKEVLSISSDGQMRVLSSISTVCLNAADNLDTDKVMNLHLTSFTLSSTRNKFTVVGCSILTIFEGFRSKETRRSGCASTCDDDKSSLVNGSCFGGGCCESKIAERLIGFRLNFQRIHTSTTVVEKDSNRCSHAFLVESGEYNFSTADFIDMQGRDTMPVVLDWAVGNSNCTVAKKDPLEYACRANNSECFDTKSPIESYICNCSRGFEGNPYLINGCVDIDECAASINPCREGYICTNSPGKYSCSCPKGFDEINETFCKRDTKMTPLILIPLSIGSTFGVLGVLSAIWFLYKQTKRRRNVKLKQRFFKRNGGLLLKQELSARKNGAVEKTRLFTAKDLDRATDKYNKNRVLGHGGQGTVYKGMLDDGRIVAVKKSKRIDERNLQQFINEVVILTQINHRNIVILHGCCLETEVPLLVYEYIPNGTLSHYICHDSEEFPLLWDVRLRIATEAATALSYLHMSATVPIYHRDIKSANILLDDKYRAKVADFGTSRSVSIDQTHLTTQVLGTFGYLDPEYFQSSQFTDKSDVYSFGVILVELLTGQKAVSLKVCGEGKSLAAYFMEAMKENRLFDILDARVIKEGSKTEIERVANIARQSLNLNGRKRPTMNEVARELESIRISTVGCNTKNKEDECAIAEEDYYWETDKLLETTRRTLSFFEGKSKINSSSDVQPFLYKTI